MSYSVAIVGATGNVGMEMLNILAEREFPVEELARHGLTPLHVGT
jgi:aspartate-semialdehyde dehydrogenase